MDSLQAAAHLTSLMHLDLDAVQVYDEALEHVTDDDVRQHFGGFRDEHEYHATVLATEIRRLGHEPPEPREDFAGHFAEMVTALRSVNGTDGAVAAMRSAERYHNRRYRQAQSLDLDAELKEVLARFYDDEQRHLEYCEKRLAAHAAH